jgi:hypothetical protein
MDIESVSLKITNYKCFGGEPQGYDRILPINLIIGRNNSGKSTLLELVDFVCSPKDISRLSHKGERPQAYLSGNLIESILRRVFSENTSGGPIPGNHWKEFGRHWVGHAMTWEVAPKGYRFVSIDPPFGYPNLQAFQEQLAQGMGNPFSQFVFKRLYADRDIISEVDTDGLQIEPNGRGATNVVQQFVNKASLPSDLIEETLLNDLNFIFEPDSSFSDIVVQQHADGRWELYLEEIDKGRIPLSHTGSGLKTILLVLIFINLIPQIENKPLSDYLFGFEELENNLHPALQRRLLLYLRKKALEEKCRLFLTTHSNVAIDLFANDEKAQILHVRHDKTCASIKRITTYVENKGILDDLDIRASDLLQANGIVWLEGPSDRLYFNRWMELCSNGTIREGTHYQCVFYGGRLLAHLSASDPDVDADQVVKILRVNRNAILIIDSDLQSKDGQINTTKQRLVSEVKEFEGYTWVTAGKEIENYIPRSAIASLYNSPDVPALKRYQDFAKYLDKIEPNEGNRFLRNKVLFAEKVCSHIAMDGIISTLDLFNQMREVHRFIAAWNGTRIEP